MGRRKDRADQAPAELNAKVQQLHAIGMELRKQREEEAVYGTAWMDQQIPKRRLSRDALYRAEQLAKLYPGTKVRTLGSLSWPKVKILLTVSDDDQRAKLQGLAIKERWSKTDLRRKVCQHQRPRIPRGGSLQPGRPKDDLVRLDERSRKWLHFVRKVWPRECQGRLGGLSPKGEKLPQFLVRAENAVQRLINQIERVLPDLE
jgi:hypothetical protein